MGSNKNTQEQFLDQYKNTIAKLVLNVGEVFTPVIQHYGQMFKTMKITQNKQCDDLCAVKCWIPSSDTLDSFGFDTYCLHEECNCQFRLEELTNIELIEFI